MITYYTGKVPYTEVYSGSGTCADSGVQKRYKQITNLGYVELLLAHSFRKYR
ncbi:hypothetical protein [Bacillus thuringiensis]|uniref:Uncharacterized protein n=1 Tax=Bacillus thuringiensis serovar andalousiensis TaxID=257985 RepID=A0A7U1BAY3_BACTU|nr:hypothetical protein [Bacillus thuringiensis]QQY96073.1 hypothetical protein EVG22_32175 [Bacillus thuringiensis serovar andalousiensis]